MSLLREVEAERDYIIKLRRDFHSHPELSLQEFRTAERIETELSAMGIEHRRIGDTGILGVIRGTLPGEKVIALRADIDALPITEKNITPYISQNPGVMHACGHDAHTACLLGAAKVLMKNRKSFGGEIRLIFQQAEENCVGAKLFLEKDELQNVGRVFALHTASDVKVGTIAVKPGINNAAVDHFKITVHGNAAHVSTPQLGSDALYIASQIVVALQGLVTRRTSPIDSVLVGVGTLHAGTAYNIIASEAVLEGTTRTTSLEMRAQIRRQVIEAAENIAKIYGGSSGVEWTEYASPLINDPAVYQEVSKAVELLLGLDGLIQNRPLSLGGDDFAEFLLHVPGAYAFLGTGNPSQPNTILPGHSDGFDIDEAALPYGAALYAEYALQWLTE